MQSSHSSDHSQQSKKAAASGWIGSALEYYDFFIYATAASLIFPQLFFPKGDPTTAIIASLATLAWAMWRVPSAPSCWATWVTPTAARRCCCGVCS